MIQDGLMAEQNTQQNGRGTCKNRVGTRAVNKLKDIVGTICLVTSEKDDSVWEVVISSGRK